MIMNNERIHKCVPARRFPEFKNDGEWVKSIFSEVLVFLPNNTLSRADLNYDKGVVKNIHYGDVLIKFGESLDVKESGLPFILDENNAQKARQGALKNGDVVIADTAEDEVVGKCTEVTNLTNEIVVSGLHTIPVRPNVPFASSFLGFYLNSESYRKQLKPLMQGIKVIALPKGSLSTTKVVYPRNIEEQRKIADCLSSMNDLISATKNKLELLKKQKNGLMQKLFPAKGKTVPEIRFKEFEKNGEWVKVLLKDVIEVNSGRDYKHLDVGDIPVYGTGGYMLSVNQKLSDVDAVGIGRKGTIDKPQFLKAPFWTVDTLFFLTVKGDVVVEFLFYLAQIIPWKKYGEQTGVPGLTKNSIENIEVLIPSKFEQRNIIRFLSLIDSEVEMLLNRMNFLKTCKKGLVQQVFPTL